MMHLDSTTTRFTAYRIICLVSHKVYIGITRRSIKERWKDHKEAADEGKKRHRLCMAIRKYGVDKFVIEEIACAKSAADLFELEKILIAQYDSFRRGYNCTTGGDGPKGLVFTAEMRKNMSLAHIGKKQSPEMIAKRVAKLKGRKYPKRSQEWVDAIRRGRKGKANWSDSRREKMRRIMKGRIFTQEWKDKISAAKKGKPDMRTAEGKAAQLAAVKNKKHPNRKSPGKHSEAHRKNISIGLIAAYRNNPLRSSLPLPISNNDGDRGTE